MMAELDVMFANWKCVPTITSKNFLEKAKKEKEELAECYEEAKRQTKERKDKEKTESEKLQEKLEPLPFCPMSDE